MSLAFNYRHLYYFWVVAKEGGVARAAERLGMAVQTVSAQVRELERMLGHALLKPAGRRLVLTEAGEAAVRQAEQIFELGEQLPELVRDAALTSGPRLRVGLSDPLPKLVVQRLLQPVLAEPQLRLSCVVDEFEDLLADLALHRLDVVIADRPVPSNPNLKLYSHLLATSTVAWYAAPATALTARKRYPASLGEHPVLLPTGHAAVRPGLDAWFERQGLRPHIAAEVEDSALLKTFGAGGMGVFPSAEIVHDEVVARYGVRRIARCDGVEERYYAIGTERRVAHPLVLRLLPDGKR